MSPVKVGAEVGWRRGQVWEAGGRSGQTSYSPALSVFGEKAHGCRGFMISSGWAGLPGIWGMLWRPFLSAGCSPLWFGDQNTENTHSGPDI